MILITPILGTTGIWKLNSPFSALLQTNSIYTLIAIRKLSELIALGNDPETDYYIANNLIHDVYLADVSNGVLILSLQNETGNIVFVPNSFLKSYPDINGVPYRVLALTANIGAIPDSLSLSNVLSKIRDDILELIGINAIVNIVAISPTTLLNSGDAAAVEAARQAKIGTNLTDYTRYIQVSAELANARQKISMLEAYIFANSESLINSVPVSALTPTQIKYLTTEETIGLSTNVISALTTAQIRALSTNSISVLTNAQLGALTTQELSVFSTTQVSALNPMQLAALTTEQLAAVQ